MPQFLDIMTEQQQQDHQRKLLEANRMANYPETSTMPKQFMSQAAVLTGNDNTPQFDMLRSEHPQKGTAIQIEEEGIFNMGSSSKIYGVALLIDKLIEDDVNPRDFTVEIGIDDIKEAIWRGELEHLLDNIEIYHDTLFKLGIVNEVTSLTAKGKRIIEDSEAIRKDPNYFINTILHQIKEGLDPEFQSAQGIKVEIDLSELCFFALRVSSNASYLTVFNKLYEQYRDINRSHQNQVVSADFQELLDAKGWIQGFQFRNAQKERSQKRPNWTNPSNAVLGIRNVVQWLVNSKNNNEASVNQRELAQIMLDSMTNNYSMHECNLSPIFHKLQAEGKISQAYRIVEKTGISTVALGLEQVELGYPPARYISSTFCILDEKDQIVASACLVSGIAMPLGVVQEANRKLDPNYPRLWKNLHLPEFLKDGERLIRQLMDVA